MPNHRLTIGFSHSRNLRFAFHPRNDVPLHTLTCQQKGGIYLLLCLFSEKFVSAIIGGAMFKTCWPRSTSAPKRSLTSHMSCPVKLVSEYAVNAIATSMHVYPTSSNCSNHTSSHASYCTFHITCLADSATTHHHS
jgi:hypothetical protein